MDSTFLYLTLIIILISFLSVFAAIIASSILINKLVLPLTKLTLYAKAVNQVAHSGDENKKMKKKLNFDIDQLQAQILKKKKKKFFL